MAKIENTLAGSPATEAHLEVLRDLIRAFDARRLGHATLLVHSAEESDRVLGPQGALWQLVMAVLCLGRGAQPRACGRCVSCRLLETVAKEWAASEESEGDEATTTGGACAHPDAFILRPETRKGYGVDAIRGLIQAFHRKQNLSPFRVAWIRDAEQLSAGGGAAANALLKLLEEPRPESFLILSTRNPQGVLPTLRSRCQSFRLPPSESLLEGLGTLPPELSPWQPLLEWLRAGAEPGRGPSLPGDSEDFWHERDTALQDLDRLQGFLWRGAREAFERLSREQGLRLLDFFVALQQLTLSIRNFGNAPLQWLSFRSDVRLGL